MHRVLFTHSISFYSLTLRRWRQGKKGRTRSHSKCTDLTFPIFPAAITSSTFQ